MKLRELFEEESEENLRLRKLIRLAEPFRCEGLHHAKKHQHDHDEPCPVEELFRKEGFRVGFDG